MTTARLSCAACIVFLVASCDRSVPGATAGPVQLVFRGGNPDAAGFGDVDVYPLDRAALAKLTSSHSVDDWHRILTVYVDSSGSNGRVLPLLGTYTVVADTVRFHPRFRPADGVTYAARFDAAALNAQIGRAPPRASERVKTVTWRHNVSPGAPSTVVRAIYPTGDVVPMNLLRMYVEFSAPMSSGRSYDFVKLYAEGDSLLEEPFFTAGGAVELWDPDRTRLTILFDPGRIKRDLKPNEEAGLPLRTGKQYRLVIDSAWRDAQGRPLVSGFVKRFRVGAQDRVLVRTSDWQVNAPRAGTRDSLVVTFPESLDRALLLRMLTVEDSSGTVMGGTPAVSERETRWAFVPRDPWNRGPHAVRVDTELEDLAGNNLRKLFDVAPGDAGSVGVSAAVVRLPFDPKQR
jgi:hypothetical protein